MLFLNFVENAERMRETQRKIDRDGERETDRDKDREREGVGVVGEMLTCLSRAEGPERSIQPVSA